MFNKKDFYAYFDMLYGIEKTMEKEATELLSIVEDEAARRILQKIISDEQRHAEIVLGLKKMI